MRILVINRDREVAERIRRMLPNDQVSVESDPNTARERILTAVQEAMAFAVILCDVGINSMCGIDLLQLARAGHEPPLFIFMTTYYQLDAVSQLGDGFVVKPFDGEELLSSIARIMKQRRGDPTRSPN